MQRAEYEHTKTKFLLKMPWQFLGNNFPQDDVDTFFVTFTQVFPSKALSQSPGNNLPQDNADSISFITVTVSVFPIPSQGVDQVPSSTLLGGNLLT